MENSSPSMSGNPGQGQNFLKTEDRLNYLDLVLFEAYLCDIMMNFRVAG